MRLGTGEVMPNRQQAVGRETELPRQSSRIDLNLFRMFAEIAAAGSLSRAAGALHVPKSTLSRRLRQLEQQLGAVLLKRGLHSLELTDIGRALLGHCQRITSEASAARGLAAE